MEDFNQLDIERTAYVIWQEKERKKISSTPEENYYEAEEKLRALRFEDWIHRGIVGS